MPHLLQCLELPPNSQFLHVCGRMLVKTDSTASGMQLALTAFTTFALLAFSAAGAELSDDEIRRLLIGQSLAQYSGNCPCPYNADRAGRSCGRRSAYSKPGGYAPLCFQVM